MKRKQRIVRILIGEILVDVEEGRREIIMLLHWAGGRHSEVRIKKSSTGHHRYCTKLEAVEVVRRMAGQLTEEQIASTLNRLGMRTGAGNTRNEGRVYSLRHYRQVPNDAICSPGGVLTLEQAASRLEVNFLQRWHVRISSFLQCFGGSCLHLA